LSISTFFEPVVHKMLLGYTVTNMCASARKKFILVHKTISPRERVESEDNTTPIYKESLTLMNIIKCTPSQPTWCHSSHIALFQCLVTFVTSNC